MKAFALSLLLTTQVALSAKPTEAPAVTNALTYPQNRAATYNDIRREQSLGRFLVAPDGSFFLYEWSQPYNWIPDNRGLSHAAAARKQTLLFKVSAPDDWSSISQPTSEDLFPAAPGATYYLGSLSPDAKHASFYQLDRDDNSLKAGIVEITSQVPPKIIWFEARPDDANLESGPIWLADDRIAYQTKKGWVQSQIPEILPAAPLGEPATNTLKTEKCADCERPAPDQRGPSTHTSPDESSDIPAAAKLVAASANGALNIFALDTPDTLNLYYRKGSKNLLVFENSRAQKSSTSRP